MRVGDAGSSTDYAYLTADRSTVTAVADESGAVVERYAYGDFGSPQFRDGAGAPIPQSAIGNPHLFLGMRFDGTWYAVPGHFDPAIGRHLTRSYPGGDIPGVMFTEIDKAILIELLIYPE
jgi:hypothetical protein